jgi:signal transduction histidine kinase
MSAGFVPRAAPETGVFSRRVVIGAAVFALFVVFDIGLFSYLILNSLSQRELEKVLLETRQVAEPIAQNLAAQAAQSGDRDLFVVVSTATEAKTYIDSVMAKRELVKSIEIRDKKGQTVYQTSNREELPLRGPNLIEFRAVGEVEVPIGELGTIVVGLSDEEVQKRIAVLRRDLVRQATLLGVVTVLLLLAAFAAFVLVYKRSRRLEVEAREAERLAYIGTLASGLAHEIRSPLNSLSLNMQLLEEEVQSRPERPSAGQQRLLSLTRSELKRLERLASDFLSYAKPQAPERQPVKVSALLQRVRGVLDGELRARSLEAEVTGDAGGAVLDADPAQLVQLLLNLSFNALAAIEAAGRSDGLLRLVGRREGEEVVLAVEDNGEGIPPEVQARMFDLFYSNRKGGTGLGLAIVERIATGHGATLEVDSKLGQGTTVAVRFPAPAR